VKKAATSFLLVMLIEAVSAIARCLKDLLNNLHHDQGAFNNSPEYC
jgi:hypothetical protein